MTIADTFSRILTMRRFLRAMDRIAAAQEQQTHLLRRIADHLAPAPPPTVSADDLRQTGSSSVNYTELGRIQDFTDKVRKDLGREPTEDEIVDFLDGREVSL